MAVVENIDIRVEVEEDAVVLVLPRRLHDFLAPWQDAFQLGDVLELAANDVPILNIIDPVAVRQQSSQIRLSKHKNLVVLLFDHTDRVRLCPEAARIVGQAIKKMAQDVSYAVEHDVHFVYNRHGLLTKLVNQKLGYTQRVR